MIILPSTQASSSTKIPHSEFIHPSTSLLPSLPLSDKDTIYRQQALSSSSSSPSLKRLKQRTPDEKTEIVALNMIILEPKEPDGYLLAGKLYEKQQRYTAARAIYAHSRQRVPHTHKRYDELRLGLKRIDMIRASFIHLLPYDVIDIIFSQLTGDDLLQCANVSLSWNSFILKWPEFWDRLIGGGYNMDPAMTHSFLDVGKKEAEERLCIQPTENKMTSRPMMMNNALLSSMLMFVTVPDGSCSIREIHFKMVILQRKHIDLLVEGVQSPNTKLERLSFDNVDIGCVSYALMILLSRCSQLKQFSFNGSYAVDYDYYWRMKNAEPVMVPNIGYRTFSDGISYYDTYMLTTLDFSMGYNHSLEYSTLLIDLIKRCPYLKRLRTSFIDYMPHGAIMRAAVDHCHSLKDLLFASIYDMRFMERNRCEDIFDDSKKEGLQRFVLYGSPVIIGFQRSMSHDDVLYVIRKHHTTLSAFHLESYFLMSLTHYGFPQLRELYLRYNAADYGRWPIVLDSPAFSQIIISLAQGSPKLQILHVFERQARATETVFPFTDDAILFVIKHCRFLERMKIDTVDRHLYMESHLSRRE